MGLREWLGKRTGAAAAREGAAERDSFDNDSTEEEVDPFNPFPEPVRIELGDVFDLHTIAPRDVKRVVEEYLSEAYSARLRSVRIIHGKGKGVQREMVRKILARTPFVREWTDAPPDAGGLGATVVHFAPNED
ncbi:MAG TPA: Smr/MutS family protein [Pyrinomonadaceae bacterium]